MWVSTGADLDNEQIRRQLRVGAAWAGPCRVAEVLAGDGSGEATFRLVGERAELILSLSRDPVTRSVSSVTLTPA